MGNGRRAIRWIGLAVAVVAAPWVVWSAVRTAQEAGEVPPLQCTQCVYAFGEVPGDAVVEHEFVLKNRSDKDLAGLQVMPDCGCITASLSEHTLSAGATARVRVRMDVQSYRGAVEKKVHVSQSGGSGQPTTLVLRGVVRER